MMLPNLVNDSSSVIEFMCLNLSQASNLSTVPFNIEKQEIKHNRKTWYCSTAIQMQSTDIEKDTLLNHATRYLHATNDNPLQCHSNAADGSGAYVYVLDSGIDFSHAEFSGRAFHGANFVPGSPDYDELGHGTQVAGIIGRDYAWCGRRLHHDFGQDRQSLRGENITVINTAVKKATNAGIAVVVSAGNSGVSAVIYCPASAITAITVAADSPNNRRAPFSNYGPCVKIFAPGVGITSTSISVREDLRGYRAVRKRVLYAASLN
ncbi:uncharacterized protein FPRO_10143 [Fusarium proliferatum ET1]|uniref:Related to alkaline protease (Oryzin) n=1 Tax=Fusarium proliferatum (strain ET1) TaxID=1227346 RepID=A0A1L7VSP7_FUSPR|nr:uncharacterized protein FPRO_10143 [Fusarium proliferatum ET1]CZR42840.1 related to alkaline protease (oryzin) [Fusarium proliferatum ET1]